MAKGINISIASDTREFDRNVRKGVIDPLDDASAALDDLGKDGSKAGDKLEKSMRDAQRETEELAKEHTALGRTIERASRQGGDGLKRNTAEATSSAKRDLQELGNEAKQNAAETFSSFDGSAESFVDGVQGTLGGIVSSIGPVGAAIGAAGALGLGFLTAEIQNQNDAADEMKQSLVDAYKSATDEGRKYLDEAHIIATATDIMFDADKYENARKEAERIGADVNTYIRAQAGSYSDLVTVIDLAREAEAKRMDESAPGFLSPAWKAEQEQLRNITAENEKLLELHERNRAAAERTARMREESEERVRDQIQRTRDADTARWDALAERMDNLPTIAQQEITVKLKPDTSEVDSYLARPKNVKLEAIISAPGRRIL